MYSLRNEKVLHELKKHMAQVEAKHCDLFTDEDIDILPVFTDDEVTFYNSCTDGDDE